MQCSLPLPLLCLQKKTSINFWKILNIKNDTSRNVSRSYYAPNPGILRHLLHGSPRSSVIIWNCNGQICSCPLRFPSNCPHKATCTRSLVLFVWNSGAFVLECIVRTCGQQKLKIIISPNEYAKIIKTKWQRTVSIQQSQCTPRHSAVSSCRVKDVSVWATVAQIPGTVPYSHAKSRWRHRDERHLVPCSAILSK